MKTRFLFGIACTSLLVVMACSGAGTTLGAGESFVGSSGKNGKVGSSSGTSGSGVEGDDALSSQALTKPEPQDGCPEPLVKPKLLSIPQPEYTTAAREADIEGKVHLELQLDEQGNVTTVALKAGLGHGLDEAALDAAKRAKFSPATRCGKPVATTAPLSLHFAL